MSMIVPSRYAGPGGTDHRCAGQSRRHHRRHRPGPGHRAARVVRRADDRHINNVFTKIGVRNRTEAATYANRHGPTGTG